MPGLVNEARTGSSTMALALIATVIIVVTITLTLGALITDTIRATDNVDTYTTRFAANTTTVANASVMTLANYKISPTNLVVWNGTGGGAHNVSVAITDRNLTCSGGNLCTFSMNTYVGYQYTTNWYLNYTWQEPTKTVATNATDQGLESLDTISNFLPVVAIVVVAAVIIGVIVSSFNTGI